MNAKKEFIEHIANRKVKCATIFKEPMSLMFREQKHPYSVCGNLSIGYCDSEYVDFLTTLDFGYDNGFGGQELYGTIWYEDGTWSERGEYDGSEWWQHNECPEIPDKLK